MSTPSRLLVGLAMTSTLAVATLAACTSAETAHPQPSTSRAVLPGGGESATTRPVRTKPTKAKPTTAKATKTTAAKVREIDRTCPYISDNDEQIAEGKKVGRSTVLTSVPVGCRFYLAYPDYHAVAQITVKKYSNAITAFNVVARTGGSSAESTPGIGDGAVLYRTRFYKPDGDQDWACIFAKGATVVTIHTDELHSSVDARNVAQAIVAKF